MLLTPARKMNILIVCANINEGKLLGAALSSALGEHLKMIEIYDDVKSGFSFYERYHPDVVLTLDVPSAYSEALTIRIRKIDGHRHTGILVLAPVSTNFDQLAEENYAAGADDVVSARMSVAILRSKIISIFNLKIVTDQLRSAVHKLHEMTLLDELTGLSNMRGFLKSLSHSMEKNKSKGFAIAMMDLDRFKSVNDSTNHMVGSHVIKSVGRILYSNKFFSREDVAARYGGDEFIMILHGDSLAELEYKIDGVRGIIQDSVFQFQDFKLKVTASIGLCWVPKNFSGKPEDIVKLADAMLYRSKELGRNRVSVTALDMTPSDSAA